MERTWKLLVLGAILSVFAFVAWDLYLVFSGSKDEFRYTLVPISPVIYGSVEEHFKSDRSFGEFEDQAKLQTRN